MNKFEEAEKEIQSEKAGEVPEKDSNTTPNTQGPSTRKKIDETTVNEFKWINLPKADQIDVATEELKISEYYSEGPCAENNYLKAKSKESGEVFYLGLDRKDQREEGDQFIIEGSVNGEKSKLRLSSWELVFKMSRLTKYCKEMNFTLVNQIVSFKRVSEGRKNAGKNWELLVPSLKLKITGEDNLVEELK